MRAKKMQKTNLCNVFISTVYTQCDDADCIMPANGKCTILKKLRFGFLIFVLNIMCV